VPYTTLFRSSYDLFDITKINHHPKFRIGIICNRNSTHRYKKFVGMTMDVFTLPIITIKRMSCFEIKRLCYTNFIHYLKALNQLEIDINYFVVKIHKTQ